MIFAVALLSLHIHALYQVVLFPLFVSPLRHVPAAHWSCRFSPLWILWRRWRFAENATILAAHQRHGSVVLLGPSELSVNCVDDGTRTIYNGGFEKHAVYPNLFTNYGVHVMFSTTASAPHGLRKRILSGIYTRSSINSSETFAQASDKIINGRMISRIVLHGTSPIDARRLFESTTMDVVSAFLFGFESASNLLENPDEAAKLLSLYQSRGKYIFWPQELPHLLAFSKALGISFVPKWVTEATEFLENWCLHLCDSAEKQLASGNTGAIRREQTVYERLRSQLSKDSPADAISQRDRSIPKQIYIASEMLDHLGAGHETSAITLTFLFHELSLRPTLQRRLRAEIATASSDEHPQAKALPLLDAAIHETLRLHAAIPGPQPRVAPHTPGGTMLGAYGNIPGGIRVSSSAWSLHRAPGVFADPESWRPERWLDGAPREQHRWFWAFGSGSRMCIGRHLAGAQIRAVSCAIIARFAVSVPGATGAPSEPLRPACAFGQEDAYTAQPVERELLLRFEPVAAGDDCLGQEGEQGGA